MAEYRPPRDVHVPATGRTHRVSVNLIEHLESALLDELEAEVQGLDYAYYPDDVSRQKVLDLIASKRP